MQDERLNNDVPETAAPKRNTRASKQTVNRRTSRAAQNRAVKGNRNQTDAIRRDLFRQMHAQAALPNLPPIPGYHVCWLTSTNTKDSIAMRRRLGYEPIKPEEVVGFGEFAVGQGGTVDGLIHVNEMVAFKLPLDIYQEYMQYAHHDAPAEQDEMLTNRSADLKKALKREGSRGLIGEGTDDEGLVSQMASIEAPDFTLDEQ